MEYALKAVGLPALTVAPRLPARAEAELWRRCRPKRLRFDTLLTQARLEQAQSLKIAWTRVLEADSAAPGRRGGSNLARLVQKALPILKQRFRKAAGPVLLVHPGLPARYRVNSE